MDLCIFAINNICQGQLLMEYNIVDTIMMLNEQCCHLNYITGGENNITAKELQVMLSLDPGVSVSSNDLARRNILSPSRMSRIIEKLVSRGFLSRETDEHDRRYSRVSLTPEGLVIYQDTTKFKKQCEAKIKSRMSDNEFAIIQKALRLLIFAMEEEHGNNDTDSIEHN
jgi:DNA-binding MarR family transcriptional regulator